MKLFDYIRDVPDFPKPGVVFKDLTPLMADPAALEDAIARLVAPFRGESIDLVAGMEARGFIFGALAANALACGFVPLRKPGKLPGATEAVHYELEYGTASLEAHLDAFKGGPRVLVVDDVLATGGTAEAALSLVERLGAEVVGCTFLLELGFLNGRSRLPGRRVHSVLMV
ncbi:MAG: adenine phosphoribosyltransferase [Pseudomonadota bacterium]|jgi:adenine phosphoribosyltransferase